LICLRNTKGRGDSFFGGLAYSGKRLRVLLPGMRNHRFFLTFSLIKGKDFENQGIALFSNNGCSRRKNFVWIAVKIGRIAGYKVIGFFVLEMQTPV